MGIGMIFGGMAEGLGAGIMSAGKQAETAALAAQKSEMSLNAQLQVLDAKRAASMEVLMAKMEAKGAGGGSNKAAPIDPELAGELAAYETGSTGAEVAGRRAIARGNAPMRDVMGATMPTAAEADTAATGPDGEDYSDRMSRVMQQSQAKPAAIGKEVDQAALDDYKANAAQMASSLRRSANPKESKAMAEAGLLDQRRGLIDQYSKTGGGPGEAALLGDGKPAYNKEVSLATGKTTDVGKSEIVKNQGAAAKDNADAGDKREGGIKPKDQKDWLDNERKSIDTERNDIRRREADLADISKSATMSTEEKAAATATLKEERANIVRRERAWQGMSERVGASIMGSPTRGASGGGIINSASNGGGNGGVTANGERIYLAERELVDERAKPLDVAAGYTQTMKDKAVAGLERNIADLKANPQAKVDTSRMGGMQSTAPSSAPPAAAKPAAPAAPGGGYKSPADVKAAYTAGKLTKDQARAALSQFGFK